MHMLHLTMIHLSALTEISLCIIFSDLRVCISCTDFAAKLPTAMSICGRLSNFLIAAVGVVLSAPVMYALQRIFV